MWIPQISRSRLAALERSASVARAAVDRGPATPGVLAGLMVVVGPPRSSLGHTTASGPVISVPPRVDYRRLPPTPGSARGVVAPGVLGGGTLWSSVSLVLS